MNKKKFSTITYLYLGLVVVLFSIYASRVMNENWEIDIDSQRENLLIFLGLLFIGFILASINFAGINEKGNKVTKSTIYGGISVGFFFLVWRLMVQVF